MENRTIQSLNLSPLLFIMGIKVARCNSAQATSAPRLLVLSAEIIQGRRGQKELIHRASCLQGIMESQRTHLVCKGGILISKGKEKMTAGSLLRSRLTRLSFLRRRKVTLDKRFLRRLNTVEAVKQPRVILNTNQYRKHRL